MRAMHTDGPCMRMLCAAWGAWGWSAMQALFVHHVPNNGTGHSMQPCAAWPRISLSCRPTRKKNQLCTPTHPHHRNLTNPLWALAKLAELPDLQGISKEMADVIIRQMKLRGCSWSAEAWAFGGHLEQEAMAEGMAAEAGASVYARVAASERFLPYGKVEVERLEVGGS